MDACVAEAKASFSEDPTERNSDRSRSRKSYPDEALGNPKRMKEWDNTHAGGRIQPRARTKGQHNPGQEPKDSIKCSYAINGGAKITGWTFAIL